MSPDVTELPATQQAVEFAAVQAFIDDQQRCLAVNAPRRHLLTACSASAPVQDGWIKMRTLRGGDGAVHVARSNHRTRGQRAGHCFQESRLTFQRRIQRLPPQPRTQLRHAAGAKKMASEGRRHPTANIRPMPVDATRRMTANPRTATATGLLRRPIPDSPELD